MFNQNSKRQTTLSFAPKPAAAAGTTGRKASATPVARSTPYERSGSSVSVTSSKSSYFSSVVESSYSSSYSSSYTARQSNKAAPSIYQPTSGRLGEQARAMATQRHQPPQAKAGAKSKPSMRKLVPTVVQPSMAVRLSERQKEAFDLAVNKCENMFITGSAGTGKSVLLREIIKAFLGPELNMEQNAVQTTASTGIAAFHIGGKTIHSFSGVGLGKGTKEDILKFVNKSRLAVARWQSVQVLIIDEISMLDAALFDAIEFVARAVRKSTQFFGGIQVILTGDFYQLPPVDKSGSGRFAFESEAWQKGIETTVVLTHVFRQKDMRFVDMLNEMRLGKLSDLSAEAFRQLARAPAYPSDGIEPTELYALRTQVDEANRRRLQSLAGKSYMFNAYDALDSKVVAKATAAMPEEIRAKIDSASMAPRQIELKRLAQVMLIKNMPDHNLVNGSRGVVVGFHLVGAREYPMVRFVNGTELQMAPETFEVDLGRERYKRTQLPVILAWALSIHKSQGQTIDRLTVDVGKIFEKGQAYVALSRAVGLDSLQVLNFAPHCVMAHPRVIQYYAGLSRQLK